jgi:hypothetical protein
MRPSIPAATLMSLSLMLASSACHHEPAEGPAEKAGAKIDKGAQDTKDAVKDSKDDVKRDLDNK